MRKIRDFFDTRTAKVNFGNPHRHNFTISDNYYHMSGQFYCTGQGTIRLRVIEMRDKKNYERIDTAFEYPILDLGKKINCFDIEKYIKTVGEIYAPSTVVKEFVHGMNTWDLEKIVLDTIDNSL